ncbi:MAG: dCTP deaminase [Candidatus Melainabacteria bacterium]|nr:dCTP deaminase [Candidatus Melainabacteria bacterium]
MPFLILIIILISFAIYFLFFSSGNLVDWQLKLYLRLGFLKIENYKEDSIQPNSLDVHLGNHYAIQMNDGDFEEIITGDFILKPGDFVLATTQEYFYFGPTLHGVLQGKSSWARVGLYVESAGLFDSGFEGVAVVELTNQGKAPLILRAGQPIAQMIFQRNLPVWKSYKQKGHYLGQKNAKQTCMKNVIEKTKQKTFLKLNTKLEN